MKITLTINGTERTLEAPAMKRLLDALREDLHLTGAKEGCGEGECGSCSVLMARGEGETELVNSCLVPILQAEGARITTIEGLAIGDRLNPVQQCFLEEGGAQCGICTPGMILATEHLLDKYPHPTLAEIQEGLAGNLCRCTGYSRIFAAVQSAAMSRGGASCTQISSVISPSPSASSPS
jgi:carbon-monoxide dehydrogenase small subunit